MDRVTATCEFREAIGLLRGIADGGPKVPHALAELSESAPNYFRVKCDPLIAASTGEIIITLEPTERLMELVAAVRASKREDQIASEA